MQVIKDGIVRDYYISKNLPEKPSMKLLSHELEFAERLVNDREKYIKEQRLMIDVDESEFKRVKDNKMREKIRKSIENKNEAIKRALRNLEIEKGDLEVLKSIIEIEIFLG